MEKSAKFKSKRISILEEKIKKIEFILDIVSETPPKENKEEYNEAWLASLFTEEDLRGILHENESGRGTLDVKKIRKELTNLKLQIKEELRKTY